MTPEQIEQQRKANRLIIIGSQLVKQGCTCYKDFAAQDLKQRVNHLDNSAKQLQSLYANRSDKTAFELDLMKKELKSNELFFIAEIVNKLSFFDEDSLESLLTEINNNFK